MSDANVLVLGGPAVGKTHYAGQLLGRLRFERDGLLRLVPGGSDNLHLLEEVLRSLDEGRAAGHTPAETWTGITLRLESRFGSEIILEWPDYAGERLLSLVDTRVIADTWRRSLATADSWMLFIRPTLLKRYEDLLGRPTNTYDQNSTTSAHLDGRGWDDAARYVELLQILLFVAGKSTYGLLDSPRLAIVLSCWDELDGDLTPDEVLRERAPLLHSYASNTWSKGRMSVWGLSSLGKPLDPSVADQQFATMGPEKFGYVVPPGTTNHESDLTAPVAWLLGVE